MSINKVIVSGNLTRDPEIRATQSGSNILTFGMAVNDRVKNSRTGEWEDYANFVDCVLFGNRAQSMSNILAKGMKVMVEGKLRWSSWERDGQKRSKIEIIVDNIDLPPRGGQQRQPQQSSYAQQYSSQGGQQIQYGNNPTSSGGQPNGYSMARQNQADVYDEDIPF